MWTQAMRPKPQCDCRICSDDNITVCLDESLRLLQMDYDDADEYEDVSVDTDPDRDVQKKLTEF